MSLDNKIDNFNFIAAISGIITLVSISISGLLDNEYSIKKETLKEMSKQNSELKIGVSNYINTNKRLSKYFLIGGGVSALLGIGSLLASNYLDKPRSE